MVMMLVYNPGTMGIDQKKESKGFLEICGFSDRQKEALTEVMKKHFVLYGGAAGGGKSYFLRWCAVALLLKWAKQGHRNVRVGLFCEDYPALRERQISKVQIEFPTWLGKLDKSNHEFVLKPEYGSGVIAFRNLDDPSKYLSAEFAAELVDELTKNEREMFDFLRMRLRWPGIEDVKFIGGTNPGSKGHGWVKRLWVDRDFREEEFTDVFNPEHIGYIRAKYSDNPHLPKNYGSVLASLPENLRRAYMDGDWDVFEGQYFTEWRRDIHVMDPFDPEDKATWNWFNSFPTYCGLDYGYRAQSAVVFGKIIDGKWWIFDEIYEKQLTYEMLRDKIIAKGHNPALIYADPAIWAKKDDPRSGADKMKPLPLQPAMNERIIGWNYLKQLMLQEEIVVFSTCQHLIRTIPSQVYDQNKIEDLDTDGEDHGCDSLRYLIASKRNIASQGKSLTYTPTSPLMTTKEQDLEEVFSETKPRYLRVKYK
jgi:phage terminase large subunit